MTRRADLLAFAAAVMGAAVVLRMGESVPDAVRVMVGMPFVTLLPGHALTLALDPEGRLGGLEWFAVAVAGSLSMAALVGLAIADSPSGVTPTAWLVSLGVVTVLLTAAAARRTLLSETPRLPAANSTVLYLPATALLLGAVAVLFVALTPVDLPRQGAGDVLQLWALPAEQGDGIRIGVGNLTRTPAVYSLKVAQAGTVISEHRLRVAAGSDYIVDMEPSSIVSTATPVVAVLSDAEGVTLRRVSIWPSE